MAEPIAGWLQRQGNRPQGVAEFVTFRRDAGESPTIDRLNCVRRARRSGSGPSMRLFLHQAARERPLCMAAHLRVVISLSPRRS